LRGITGAGYGNVWDEENERWWNAHDAMWTSKHGPVPSGFEVMHKCDTRACINPAHLKLGTRKDNLADMTTKGRRRGCIKLTLGQVVAIRADPRSQHKIAAEYGVTQSNVWRIKHGRTWVET